LRYVKQHDANDCGPACLAMISYCYGVKYPLHKYREISNYGKSGTSLEGLVIGGQKLGFETEALKGSFIELKESVKKSEVRLPFIAHLKYNHFVVVTKISNDKVELLNPAEGKLKIAIDEFEKCWSGYIVNFLPTLSVKPVDETDSTLKRILYLIKPLSGKIAIIFSLSIMVYIVSILSSFTFEVLINSFSLVHPDSYEDIREEDSTAIQKVDNNHQHSHDNVNNLTFVIEEVEVIVESLYEKTGTISVFFILLGIMYFICYIASYIRGRIVIFLSKSIDSSLTYKYFIKILKLPIRSKVLRNDGDYISRFNDAYRIRYAISNATVTILIDSILGILGGIVLFKINEGLFCVAFGIIVLYSLCAYFFQNKLKNSNIKAMESNAEMQSYLKEILCGYDNIKCNDLVYDVINKGTDKYNAMIETYYQNDKLGLQENVILGFIQMLGNTVILWLGFTQVINGYMQLGTLISFTTLLSAFTEPLKNIVQLQPTIQSAAVSLDRLFEIFNIKEEDYDKNGYHFSNGDITFKNVTFGYLERHPIINKLNIYIAQNTMVAITGISGCGKSTVAKLLSRLYVPDDGLICVGSHSISDYELHSYRSKVYYLNNNPFTFSGSIKYNLIEDRKDINDDEIDNVCEQCQLSEFINNLPLKYDTYVSGEEGALSQGQKQRLGIARAILHRPEILVLDEALSNLSEKVASDILCNTRKMLAKCTIILISHDTKLNSLCDKCINLCENVT
jgi:ATP-binding cassette subfamily B protein